MDDYAPLGPEFAPQRELTAELRAVLRPRAQKQQEQKTRRTRARGEVFTPAWICAAQNDLTDLFWTGRGQTEYVDAPRLELACGEAPYLAGGRDAVTGRRIPLSKRTGMLDRKLRAAGVAAQSEEEWMCLALRAVRSVYGFEFQGDSLLLARENLLHTFEEAVRDRLNCAPAEHELLAAAKAHGAKVIGVSSHEHAETCPLDHPARHPSKKNLHDVVDCSIDCKVKLGDATLEIPGFEQKIGALSTYANAYVMNCVVIEAINMLVNEGVNPPVWRSGNCPGGDEWNNQFLERFRGAVRCL